MAAPHLSPPLQAALEAHYDAQIAATSAARISQLPDIWADFWGTLTPAQRAELSQPAVLAVTEEKDRATYSRMLSLVIPDVFQHIPAPLTKAIRSFAKGAEGYMRQALEGYDSAFADIKSRAAADFGQVRHLTIVLLMRAFRIQSSLLSILLLVADNHHHQHSAISKHLPVHSMTHGMHS